MTKNELVQENHRLQQEIERLEAQWLMEAARLRVRPVSERAETKADTLEECAKAIRAILAAA